MHAQLEELLESTHRKVPPFKSSNGGNDVWKALMDLDVGQEQVDSVLLIYQQANIPAHLHGTSDTGNREQM
jgi:hypothetical protein